MIQLSLPLRDTQANALGTLIANGSLELRSGPPPANCAAADTGTLLCPVTLPATPLTTASSSGQVTRNGTWSGTGSAGAGGGTLAGHFRLKSSGGVVHFQGTVSQAGAAWAATTAYVIGQYVTNGGNLYVCDQSGTSAGSGGPSGTGTNITDNTARWDYVSAVGDMTIDNASIAAGQAVNINTFSYTRGGA